MTIEQRKVSECITLKIYHDEDDFVEVWVFEEGMERAERVGLRQEELSALIEALKDLRDGN